MKKLLPLIAFIAPLLSFAQVEKGMFLVSGNVSYSKGANDSQIISPSPTQVRQIQISPYLGYLVSSKVAVGVLGTFWRYDTDYGKSGIYSPSNSTQKTYNAGVFVRYYQPITERFFFFAQGDVMFGKGTSQQFLIDTGSIYKVELTNTTISLRPGISYFVSKRWAVELMLGSIIYTHGKQDAGSITKSDGFAFNFLTRGLSPGVVFTF